MLMPMGKFKGQPVHDMSTAFLLWLVSNDNIRFVRWDLIHEVLGVLRLRFDNFDTLLAELKVDSPPPAYWKKTPTLEQIKQRNKEKAEKLHQLEANRAEERRIRQENWRARRAAAEAQEAADTQRRCEERRADLLAEIRRRRLEALTAECDLI